LHNADEQEENKTRRKSTEIFLKLLVLIEVFFYFVKIKTKR